ncbi:hypothetical protein HanRHA438_Chr13g0583191 [Helianthus annuus]|uniref:Uncharacterized protein n=1 Tax=Helianthus annuus TaxID=4232 RepID=A0A251SQ48_HELAN|nr:hypothetical protein HanXRQr2_Chr13g0572021 [Helianthus annuus]KAJ0479692.1 hypothetical protein HanIR_Chr13g0622941 [Helianthus annuus]KAJ0847897.1 hypothetical protein HanPSC8_Chr13g0550701 [Helianthus annuus]KAJ0856847.1 hypothetical protein HanRHA438_Chr13g0583191 [Helianthus annuus]
MELYFRVSVFKTNHEPRHKYGNRHFFLIQKLRNLPGIRNVYINSLHPSQHHHVTTTHLDTHTTQSRSFVIRNLCPNQSTFAIAGDVRTSRRELLSPFGSHWFTSEAN